MDDTYNASRPRAKSDEMQIGGVETQKPALNRVGTLRRLGYYALQLNFEGARPMAASKFADLTGRYRRRPRRRCRDEQGRRQEDRRRAGRRPGAQCPAGHGRAAPTANCRWCGRWPRARSSTRPSWCRPRWRSRVFLPWLITPLLMIGGAFLCFEGSEKLAHKFLHSPEDDATHKAAHVARAWPIPKSTWSRWKRTRSRARCAPTSSCRPRSS